VKRVMVIDGHRRIRELLIELLGGEPGLEVVGSAATGADGTDLAGRLRPDVVVVDPDLLEAGGAVEATRQILISDPEAHVLVVTAAPHGTLAAQLLAAGARTCLAKSAAYTAIVKAIRSS